MNVLPPNQNTSQNVGSSSNLPPPTKALSKMSTISKTLGKKLGGILFKNQDKEMATDPSHQCNMKSEQHAIGKEALENPQSPIVWNWSPLHEKPTIGTTTQQVKQAAPKPDPQPTLSRARAGAISHANTSADKVKTTDSKPTEASSPRGEYLDKAIRDAMGKIHANKNDRYSRMVLPSLEAALQELSETGDLSQEKASAIQSSITKYFEVVPTSQKRPALEALHNELNFPNLDKASPQELANFFFKSFNPEKTQIATELFRNPNLSQTERQKLQEALSLTPSTEQDKVAASLIKGLGPQAGQFMKDRMHYLKDKFSEEITRNPASLQSLKNTFMRGTDLNTKLLAQYLKLELRDLMVVSLQDPELNESLHAQANKLSNRFTEKEQNVRSEYYTPENVSVVSEGIELLLQGIKSQADQRQGQLQNLQEFMGSFYNDVKDLFKDLPDADDIAKKLIVANVFLRFISPAILVPTSALNIETPYNDMQTTGFAKWMGKVTQTIANQSTGQAKDEGKHFSEFAKSRGDALMSAVADTLLPPSLRQAT